MYEDDIDLLIDEHDEIIDYDDSNEWYNTDKNDGE